MIFNGLAGDDDFLGTKKHDVFNLGLGGHDRARGMGGADTFNMGAAFDADDRIDGGTGNDTVVLNGDYYNNWFTFTATTMVNVETLDLAGGFGYSFTFDDATVAVGKTLTIDGSALGAGDFLSLSGETETDGRFAMTGGAGDDVLVAGHGNDNFDLSRGGTDFVLGNDGDDIFALGGALNASDRLYGGAGADTVTLDGDYSFGLVLGPLTLVGVETLTLTGGHTYDLVADDSNVDALATLTVDASTLAAADALRFDGRAERDGSYLVKGGKGNDDIATGDGADTILTGTGVDRVSAGAGDDTVDIRGNLTGADRINGGAGMDVVLLNGDYTGARAVTFAAATIVNVETLRLAAGHNYDLTLAADNVPPGALLTVNGGALGAANALTIATASPNGGQTDVIGGAGNDVVTYTGSGIGTVDFTKGGHDTLNGLAAPIAVVMGAALENADRIRGGNVFLDGNYSGAHKLVLGAATFHDVTGLFLAAGHDYNVTMNDANLSANTPMFVAGFDLGAGDRLIFDGSAETDASFTIIGGAGDDNLTGGKQSDLMGDTSGGADRIHGGGGDDFIGMNDTFDNADRIDGGSGDDLIVFNDLDYSIALDAFSLLNIETMRLDDGNDYLFVMNEANVAAGRTMTIDATDLETNHVVIDGSVESDGSFHLLGGGGIDQLYASRNDDVLSGGGGRDSLTGGLGADQFAYSAVTDATSTGFDVVFDFDTSEDRFDMPFAVSKVDPAITGGTLNDANFDGDMAIAVSALGKHHAVLFTCDDGDYAGQVFLIVDANKVVGYQASADYVIEIAITGTLTKGDFI